MDKPIPEAVLLPCPFCGGEATLTITGNVRSTRKCMVKCGGCRYQRIDAALRYGDDWLRATAIAAWNRRTLTAAQQPDHIVDATKMVAQQQGQAEGCQWAHEVVVRGQSAATSSGTGCAATGGRCNPGTTPDCPPAPQPMQQGQAGAICPNCERPTEIRHCQACGADFINSAPQPMQQGGGEVASAVKFLAGVRVFLATRERIKQPEGLDMFDEAIETLRNAYEVDHA